LWEGKNPDFKVINENLVILTEKEYNEMDKLRQRASHNQKITAVKKFLSDVKAIKEKDNVLTDTDWNELADIRLKTNLTRKIEL
jgi:hypothetical protein